MSTYTIGQVAERSGFTASALRYYEGIGLVTPATRTDSGYRVYDDQAIARLSFIRRAKQLGCSLQEIIDLVGIWDGGCGPVQRRFHDLVTAKIADAEQQVHDLIVLTAQLHTAAGQLAGPATDGPCGDGCVCLDADPVVLSVELGDPPIACTLDADAVPARLEEWRAVLALATSRTTGPDGTLRVELCPEVPLTELARLVAAEQQCCPFFSFAITVDHRGVGLEVQAPAGADQVVADLFGEAA